MARRSTKTAQTNRVAAYLRVSTREQAEHGISLDAQESAVRAYCAMRGLELAELVVDTGVSAGKPLANRPGGRRVLDMVDAGEVAGVVAFKLDRLFRSAVDCLTTVSVWDRSGAALHLVSFAGQAVDTSSAIGRFFLTMVAGLAELERNQIGERTSAALSHLRDVEGVKLGGAALGWRRTEKTDKNGRRIVADAQAELDTVARILELRAEGLAYRAIAARLAAEGCATKRGGRWQAQTVRRVVVREEMKRAA